MARSKAAAAAATAAEKPACSEVSLLVDWLATVVDLQQAELHEGLARALLDHYGCREPSDLKYLGENDVARFLRLKCATPLKTAQAGKLSAALRKVTRGVQT